MRKAQELQTKVESERLNRIQKLDNLDAYY